MWIDFKLYFYVRIHKLVELLSPRVMVVNWFQIVFLREDSQDPLISFNSFSGCELISNCIFTWGFTSGFTYSYRGNELWIDFKLYFYVRIHKYPFLFFHRKLVVNWFQIVFLREDSQEVHRAFDNLTSCELISNCIFTWGFTRIIVT